MAKSVFENLPPELKEKLAAKGMLVEDTFIRVVSPAESKITSPSRSIIRLTNDKETLEWEVPSLLSLFRGNKKPPEFRSGPPPIDYEEIFTFLESQIIAYARIIEFPRDGQFEEVFSLLRRRTDGKSTGPLHDFVWQASGLMLAFYPLSKEEFEGIVNRLERSGRTFKTHAGSHNYMETLDLTYPEKLILGAKGF